VDDKMDYKDGNVVTYGDMYFCSIWKPTATYEPGFDVTNPLTLNHTYL
jgi:hypothetical protein